MITRDAYQNSRTSGGDAIVAHVYPKLTSSFAAHAVITDISDSTYHAMFTPVVSGEWAAEPVTNAFLLMHIQAWEASALKF